MLLFRGGAHAYRENLTIVREIGDRAAQGRACGNLGNTHYLLGNFSTAISFHQEVSQSVGGQSCRLLGFRCRRWLFRGWLNCLFTFTLKSRDSLMSRHLLLFFRSSAAGDRA